MSEATENLATRIAERSVPQGAVALYWLCQAGFAFKTSAGQIVYIDPYLSEVVERVVGFKRMMACPIEPEDVTADLVICTHEHLDHMDVDALPILATNPRAHFAGPIECMKEFEKLRIPASRCHLLEEGKSVTIGETTVHAVYADHGELAPDALGVVLDLDGIRIYHTGDTAYRPDEFRPAIRMNPDILLPCINGAFGNMDCQQAAQLTQLVAPRLVIPTHFWMFVQQNGDPGRFLQLCGQLAPSVQAMAMRPGEELLFRRPV